MSDIDSRLKEIETVRVFTPSTFKRARETAQLARGAIADLEANWSNCSQTCARLQDERDRALRELNRVTRGDVSNVITTLGDALTYISKLERSGCSHCECPDLHS